MQQLTHTVGLKGREQSADLENSSARLQPHSANTPSLITRAQTHEVLISLLHLILLPSQCASNAFPGYRGGKELPRKGKQPKAGFQNIATHMKKNNL